MTKTDNLDEIYKNGEYLSKNPYWHIEDSPWKASEIDKIIQLNYLSLKTICEVGCGAGEIIHQLSQKNQYNSIEFSGYEISENAFEFCQRIKKNNINFYKEDLLTVNKKFDLLLCIDVFEHVEDYLGFLKNLKKISDYHIFHIPLDLSASSIIRGALLHTRETVGHLHYFTKETAIATLQDCGYQIVDARFTPLFNLSKSKNWKTKIAWLPRKILYTFFPRLMSRLIGGASLMVLTKNRKI